MNEDPKEKDFTAKAGSPEPSTQAEKPDVLNTAQPAIDGVVAKKRKMKTSHKIATVALVLVAAILIGLLSAYSAVKNEISGENTEAGVLPAEVKQLPEHEDKGVIHGLICGIDYSDEEEAAASAISSQTASAPIASSSSGPAKAKVGNTDMILYMMYDTVNNKANFMQIPRDVYVGEDVETGGWGKINSLYKYSPDTNNRMAALAKVINSQLRLPIDFYVTIDMDALKEIIDIKGSIQVYVPVEVNDPKDPNAVIGTGLQYFTSDQAEFYLRNRHSDSYNDQGDIMRLQMQQSFYSAMFRDFKTLTTWNLVMWMEVLLWRCDTDMDPLELGRYAQKALNIEGADITFVRPPVGGSSMIRTVNGKTQNVFMLSLIPEETAELLNTYFRPEGQSYSVDELDIQTLPIDEKIGISETNIRTMSDIQSAEEQVAASTSVASVSGAKTPG